MAKITQYGNFSIHSLQMDPFKDNISNGVRILEVFVGFLL